MEEEVKQLIRWVRSQLRRRPCLVCAERQHQEQHRFMAADLFANVEHDDYQPGDRW